MNKRPCILVVDDVPVNIHVVSLALKSDYEIIIAENGETALELAHRPNQPDLILLDVVMPEMGGFEVCRRLKESEATRDIPVIFVTTKSETGDEEQGFRLGAADYITKPFEPSLVRARVKTHLELKSRNNELEKRNAELLTALDKVKLLNGLLPICASCKKIRDDKGYWNQIEVYVRDHSEAEFTHGICPDCARELGYPEIYAHDRD